MKGSLRLKISILVLISVLIPLGVFTFMSLKTSEKVVEDISLRSFNVIGSFVSDRISSYIEEKVRSVKEYSGRSVFLNAISLDMGETAIGDMERIMREDKSFIGFQLYNINGKLIATSDENIKLPKEFIDISLKTGKENKPFISDILDLNLKDERFGIAISHPVQTFGILIGILRLSSVSSVTKELEERVISGTGFKSAYPYIVSLKDLKIAHHPSSENVGKTLSELNLRELERDLKDKRSTSRYLYQGKEKFVTINYIEKDNLKLAVVIGVNLEEVLFPLSYLRSRAIIIGSIIAIAFLILGILFGNSIVRPMRELMGLAQRAASGDLSFSIPKLTRDEVGELCTSLDSMMKSLKEVIKNTSERSLKLDESSSILSKVSDETAKAVSATTERIVEITENTRKQTEELRQASQALEGLAQTINSAYQSAQSTKSASQRADEASMKIKEASQHAIENMIDIRKEVLSTAEAVKKLGERSKEINQIVDLITNLADQTNLLALNAAIEAARAGEAGRGFAVVAEEVRKLAEASAQAAMQIAKLIEEIRRDTDLAVQSMVKSSKAVEKGTSLAEEVKEAVESIISAASETKGFIDKLEEIISVEVKTSEEVVRLIKEINAKAERNSQAIEDVSANAQEITASSEEVASAASELKDIARSIKDIISKFKIEEVRIKEVGA